MENIESTQIENTENTESTESMDAEDTATEQQLEAEANKTPAWVDFIAALDAHAKALGLDVQEQKGFMKFQNLATGHKLYVAKQGKEVKRVDTTLPILGQDGTYPLLKANGKIACHVVPEVERVSAVLTQLADDSVGKIRPAKRAAKAESASSEPSPAAEQTPAE